MYALVDTKYTTELFLVRRNWFSKVFELKDDLNTYGKITINPFFLRRGTIETAVGSWTLVLKFIPCFFYLIIKDQNGIVAGKATRSPFSRKTKLTMEGFKAKFYGKVFEWPDYVWESALNEEIMGITGANFSLTRTVILRQTATPPDLIQLLAFLGLYLSSSY